MHTADDQGRLRIQTLRLFSERTGKPHDALKAPEVNPAGAYLWQWFRELDSSGSLTHQELQAWAHMTDRRPHRWEIDALRLIDKTCAAAVIANRPKPKATNDRHRATRS